MIDTPAMRRLFFITIFAISFVHCEELKQIFIETPRPQLETEVMGYPPEVYSPKEDKAPQPDKSASKK